MFCCDQLSALEDEGIVHHGRLHSIAGGRILTEIDTDYFFVTGGDRPSYVGLNYCPFCGRPLSRDLWNREKKK